MSIVMSLLVFTACSDDSVNDFSPVPYPDEVGRKNRHPIRHLTQMTRLLIQIRYGK